MSQLFSVISYYNYRKEVGVNFLKTFSNYNQAKKYAFYEAKCHFSDRYSEDNPNIVNGVAERYVDIGDVLVEYTKGDGYGKLVFAVIELPNVEPFEECSSDCDINDESDKN